MNNQRPGMGEQLLRSLMLSFAAMWIISYFFGWPGQPKQNQQAARDPKLTARATLPNAFEGLQEGSDDAPSKEKAQAEIAALQKEIAANASDKYAHWARLRSGLLSQYVVGDMPAAIKSYDEAISYAVHDEIDAQALYQKGDWQWKVSTPASTSASASTSTPTPTRQDASYTFEMLVQRGKTDPAYFEKPIFVPVLAQGSAQNAAQGGGAATDKAAATALPAQGFRQVKISELKGTLREPNPQGILDRINIHYGTTPLNQGMDKLVNLFGAHPEYSYGLAIMLLATALRIIMQPINRRQYDSMKGMSVIGPDMKKIQEKYKSKPSDSPEVQRDKQMKAFAEIRALQKEHGVNPQMGCALMFVQLPVFFYFVNPLMMHYEPKMALDNASFLWVQNLAVSDNLLLGLYGLSMLVSFRLSSMPPTDDMQRQMQLMTTFVFPIMLPFFMRGFSSAFILYWMTFNFVSMIFQYRMMKGSDPDKSVLKTLFAPISISGDSASKTPESTPATAAVPPRPRSMKSKSIVSSTPVDGAQDSNTSKIKTIAPAPRNGRNGSSNGAAREEGEEAVSLMKTPAAMNGGPHANGAGDGESAARPERVRDGRTRSSAQRARRRRRY